MKDEHYGREFNVTMPKGAYDDLLKYKQAFEDGGCIWVDYYRIYVLSKDETIYELERELKRAKEYEEAYKKIKRTLKRPNTSSKTVACKCWLCRIFG